MITITPSVSNIVDVGALTGDVSVRVDGIASYPEVKPDQWFWLFMKYGDEQWVIVDPLRLSNDLINNGVEGRILKSSLQRLPSDSRLMLAAYLKGKVEDVANIQIVNSGDGSGGGGGGVDVVEDFETYASGDRTQPFETPNITFLGTNMLVTGSASGRYFGADIQGETVALTLDLKGLYKTATIDIAIPSGSTMRVRCSYENNKTDERQVSSKTWTNLEFVHNDIRSLKITSIYNGYPLQVLIDNIKLFV